MKIISPVETMNDLKSVCVLLILLGSNANCRPQEENLVKDNVDKIEKEIIINGDLKLFNSCFLIIYFS